MKRLLFTSLIIISLLFMVIPVSAAAPDKMVAVNLVLKESVSEQHLAELKTQGELLDVMPGIRAVRMKIPSSRLGAIRNMPFVASANPDAVRTAVPVTAVEADNFADGLGTWDLDAINVTDFGEDNRTVAYDGTGVYVAVLDTGLVSIWRDFSRRSGSLKNTPWPLAVADKTVSSRNFLSNGIRTLTRTAPM